MSDLDVRENLRLPEKATVLASTISGQPANLLPSLHLSKLKALRTGAGKERFDLPNAMKDQAARLTLNPEIKEPGALRWAVTIPESARRLGKVISADDARLKKILEAIEEYRRQYKPGGNTNATRKMWEPN